MHLGAVVVADDPVAADVVVTRMMGFDPTAVPYLMEAGKFLGQADEARIHAVAEDASSLEGGVRAPAGFDELRST